MHRICLTFSPFLCCIIVLCFCRSGAYGQQSAQQIQRLIDNSKQAVVKIYVTGTTPDGKKTDEATEGTGFFVASNKYASYIVTARHVIGSSDPEQTRNPNWKVGIDGTPEREIRVESFDERGNLQVVQGSVAPWPTDPSMDIAILKIDRGPYPTLTLGSAFQNNSPTRSVLLLGFPSGSRDLSKTPVIGYGQAADLSFRTSTPTHEGESGGPWIDVESKKVVAVASQVRIQPIRVNYLSSPIDLITPMVDFIDKEGVKSETKTNIPLQTVTENADIKNSNVNTPATSGIQALYFAREADGDTVKNTLDSQWTFKNGSPKDKKSNVITCGSDATLPFVKEVANKLLDSGVAVQGIAPQKPPNKGENKVTIEYYDRYENHPVLNKETVSQTTHCPDWSEVLWPFIRVTNYCTVGSIDVYVRYVDSMTAKTVTAVKYALGPGDHWMFRSGSGSIASAGTPTVRAVAFSNRANAYSYYNVPRYTYPGQEQLLQNVFASIPDGYFVTVSPDFGYNCPAPF
jgi:S1-C subfamily serine protease